MNLLLGSLLSKEDEQLVGRKERLAVSMTEKRLHYFSKISQKPV